MQYSGHVLYKTGDIDAPEVIKDRNGEVVLSQCRICGYAESGLSEPCVPQNSFMLYANVCQSHDHYALEVLKLYDEMSPEQQIGLKAYLSARLASNRTGETNDERNETREIKPEREWQQP